MDEIKACVRDVLAIANSVAWRDWAQAKRSAAPPPNSALDQLIIWLDREHLGRGIRT